MSRNIRQAFRRFEMMLAGVHRNTPLYRDEEPKGTVVATYYLEQDKDGQAQLVTKPGDENCQE